MSSLSRYSRRMFSLRNMKACSSPTDAGSSSNYIRKRRNIWCAATILFMPVIRNLSLNMCVTIYNISTLGLTGPINLVNVNVSAFYRNIFSFIQGMITDTYLPLFFFSSTCTLLQFVTYDQEDKPHIKRNPSICTMMFPTLTVDTWRCGTDSFFLVV